MPDVRRAATGRRSQGVCAMVIEQGGRRWIRAADVFEHSRSRFWSA